MLSSLLSHGGHISNVSPLGQEKSATVDATVTGRHVRARSALLHIKSPAGFSCCTVGQV